MTSPPLAPVAPPAPPADGRSHRLTWALAAASLGLAVACGAAALMGGGLATASAAGFGAAFGADAGAAPRSGAVDRAPVVAPSVVPGVADVAAAPPAAVSRTFLAGAAAFRPARLILPDARSAPIRPVGLHTDGTLVVPDDPLVVGWWTGGALAGESFGSVVVAGHLDSASRGVGVLAALPGLRAGQVVQLAAGARRVRYTVVGARLVPQAELTRTTGLFRAGGPAQLVLVTCGGRFDPVRHRYADNFVVVARPSP